MAYVFQGLTPAFNNDDVRQLQPPEISAMITQGRWLYSFIFNHVLDQNPLPGLSTFAGSACLVGAAWMHAKLIGLRHTTSLLILGAVSSISIYYGYMFDFDSTRTVYPLGNLLSASGLVLVQRSGTIRSRLAGVALLGLSPALYPATVMYQVTLLLTAALYWTVRDGRRTVGRALAIGFSSIAAGVILYRLMTTALYSALDLQLDDRGSLNPLGLRDNWATIETIFFDHALPFLAPSGTPAYFPATHSYAVLIILVVFLVTIGAGHGSRRSVRQLAAILLGLAALLVSPYFLIAVTETDYYPIRSLYSYAAVRGALLGIAFEVTVRAPIGAVRPRWIGTAVLLIAACFTLINASLVGQRSTDQALAWQTDVARVNRVIYRIDEKLAEEPAGAALGAEAAQIPIVVIGDVHWRSGPRGQAVSSWLHPWSREYIFRLIDDRFVPASPRDRERVAGAARERAAWPASDSVYVDDGVVVVVR